MENKAISAFNLVEVEAELGNITLNHLTCQGLGKQTAAPWNSKEALETFGFLLQLPICLIKLNILNYR